ncbi:MAG: ATP-binding cassette domain-containing protein [Anaerolineales bacterium]|nr:ATP-binding cassette domain-containing protein [Anaerolineales bacterium]
MRVELEKISKSFGPVQANRAISLAFEPGLIYGLLGENGAGKSTLMKILSGYQPADSGRILLDGAPQRFRSPLDALAAGVGMLYQDPLDLPPFTVLENYLLGRRGGLAIPRRRAAGELRELGARYGFEVHPHERIEDLSLGERQQLELLRLLSGGARLLILDEPTTGISAAQKELLFNSLRSLARDEGKTLILVSHKLDEVQELCNRAYVLRKGELAGEAELPCPNKRLVGLMFGQLPSRPARPRPEAGPPRLELRGAAVRSPRLRTQPTDLQVGAGEVLGLAGLEGSGQELLLRACAGLLPLAAGELYLSGVPQRRLDYLTARQLGVHYLAAGRLEEGLVSGMTLSEHMALVNPNGLFVDRAASKAQAAERIRQYQVVARPRSRVEELSGGNQQRFLFGLLPPDAQLILAEHPTRGLDLRSSDWIWGQLDERRKQGAAIVFLSAELDEILERSDRIAVFFAGRLSRVLPAGETSVDELGHLIGGGA